MPSFENTHDTSTADSCTNAKEFLFTDEEYAKFFDSSTINQQEYKAESLVANAKINSFAREIDSHQQSTTTHVPSLVEKAQLGAEPWTAFLTDPDPMNSQRCQRRQPQIYDQQQHARPHTVANASSLSCKLETSDGNYLKAASDSGYGTRGFESPATYSQLSMGPPSSMKYNVGPHFQPLNYPNYRDGMTVKEPIESSEYDLCTVYDFPSSVDDGILPFDDYTSSSGNPDRGMYEVLEAPPYFCHHINCDHTGKSFKNQSDFKYAPLYRVQDALCLLLAQEAQPQTRKAIQVPCRWMRKECWLQHAE